jgi:hypothetical protein
MGHLSLQYCKERCPIPFFAIRRVLDILQECFDILEVCFDIISVFATAVDLADTKIGRPLFHPGPVTAVGPWQNQNQRQIQDTA